MFRPPTAGGTWRDRTGRWWARTDRWRRRTARLARQATAASITSPDPADGTPPGTLAAAPPRPPRRAGRRGWARRPGPVPVISLLLGVLVTLFGVQSVTGITLLPSGLPFGAPAPPRKFPVLESSPPVAIGIRSLDLDAPVHPVGVAPDGTIEVPASDRRDEAGWYSQSPTPGQYGPSVIVGHVDTRTGPAVFHDLSGLRPGAKIEVDREDESVAVFEVNSVRRYNKSELPVDQVYGDFSRPSLRLITCGGRWVGGSTGYADNVIVFASLVSARHT
ncbi:class F sortase [Plantactinospora sp. BC1]|uniref:class F sortase n=1 Tax=Plantactinospora sp. BC1 TaxID=2108470 RepID=UPI000D16C475|nr:class F sortase [Plantactinospora sp. BC1]AVT33086.1 class F sortase [Plantactinospora sp. BC1]